MSLGFSQKFPIVIAARTGMSENPPKTIQHVPFFPFFLLGTFPKEYQFSSWTSSSCCYVLPQQAISARFRQRKLNGYLKGDKMKCFFWFSNQFSTDTSERNFCCHTLDIQNIKDLAAVAWSFMFHHQSSSPSSTSACPHHHFSFNHICNSEVGLS